MPGPLTEGTIKFPPTTAAGASIRLPHGTAPSSPTNGDVWTTTTGLFARINGATVQMGAGTDASALTTGNLAYARLPTGAGSWDTGAGTTLTMTRALTVSGLLTGSIGVLVSGGNFAAGKLYKDGSYGTSLAGATGSIADFALLDPAGTPVLTMPTGTNTVRVAASFQIASTSTAARLALDYPGNTLSGLRINDSDSATGTAIAFARGGSAVGSIVTGAGTTTYNTTSDVRAKREIRDTSIGIDVLRRVRVRDYELRMAPGVRQQGLIAQELVDVYPEAVCRPGEKDGLWMVDYGRMTPLLVKSLQELDARVRQLEHPN